MKQFMVGDQVKIVNGEYKDFTGRIKFVFHDKNMLLVDVWINEGNKDIELSFDDVVNLENE